ncbi:MAG: hypothetical protein GY896_05130 [Gammaproteobacteria bacterium]|nr:hypothetical protein [Gammaproteobacteria bacterium]
MLAHVMPRNPRSKTSLYPLSGESLPTLIAKVSPGAEQRKLAINRSWQDADLQTQHSLETLCSSAYDEASRQRRKHRPV